VKPEALGYKPRIAAETALSGSGSESGLGPLLAFQRLAIPEFDCDPDSDPDSDN
jgi:hypothetical protein